MIVWGIRLLVQYLYTFTYCAPTGHVRDLIIIVHVYSLNCIIKLLFDQNCFHCTLHWFYGSFVWKTRVLLSIIFIHVHFDFMLLKLLIMFLIMSESDHVQSW